MTVSPRPRVVSSTPAPPSCPSDLDLARFADGRLDGATRALLVAHLAGCDDCREILVTVMAAGAAPAHDDIAPAAPPAAPAALVVPRYRRRAALVAGLAVAALGVFAFRVGPPEFGRRDAAVDRWSDIAAAVGATRIVEARISGLPEHLPLASPTRSASGPASFDLQAVAARLDTEAAAPSAPVSARHLAGVALLLSGRGEAAVTALEQALAAGGAGPAAIRAAILTDLAAAHAELGETNARGHWTHALAAADAALAIDATLAAARFNRALALEHLGRPSDALEAWRAVAEDPSVAAGWRDEALSHVHLLSVP